ncbi:hypothetical protein EIN_375190 [Entamoeba invadens IP1]|uniref:Uncharacterized protein n=1 Tax=Entamoeba invadens IP1 TaxID=370355 RepID=A0A0A1TU54_ENTIV|nr:hypothetical protein EIN_375190 [Entamoeba invadens IP1]ELP83434.1 hypothetical protein EIN_375190 [Entamoeba invadens IP1]|eukprot:XP_004182780.1 hypothetical protein EIN_375190 [Entamoeba invadens IP1]
MDSSYKSARNYQVCEQCFMLLLLNKYAEIEFMRKKKKSTQALPFLQVKTIFFSQYDSIDFVNLIETKCKGMMESEIKGGLAQHTAQRRYNCNLLTESLHLLMDILEEFGFYFSNTLSSGKNGTIKAEKIGKIGIKDAVFYEDVIREKGQILNKLVCSKLEFAETCHFVVCSSELQSIFSCPNL